MNFWSNMMKSVAILLLLLVQVAVVSSNDFSIEVKSTISSNRNGSGFNFELNILDIILVFLCFTVAYILHKNQTLNTAYRKRLMEIKIKCVREQMEIGKVIPYMEGCRSRNTNTDISLRKIKTGTESLIKDVKLKLAELEQMQNNFESLKISFTRDRQSYPTSEALVMKQLELAKVNAEMAELRNYIDVELNNIRGEIDRARKCFDSVYAYIP